MNKFLFSLLASVFLVLSANGAKDVAQEAGLLNSDVAVITDSDQAAQILGRTAEESLSKSFQEFINQKNDLDIPISIDTDSPNDVNWDGALQVAEASPEPVVLPFLPFSPFEYLEVKFRLLKKRF